MRPMTAVHEITTLDLVELTEAIEGASAGSQGGVLEIRDDNVAMLEITTMPLEPMLDRIIFAPVSKLRRIG